MPTESLLIGLFVLLICGAVSFYLYVRLMYAEKKLGVMESILVDLKVAFDSLMSEHVHHHAPPAPIVQTPGLQMSTPVPLEPAESENVVEGGAPVAEADANAEASAEASAAVPEEQFYSSILEQVHDNVAAGEPNLDGLSRADLITLAEKKGLRVKKSMNRENVLNLLRRSDKSQNETLSTENVSGPIGNGFQAGASLDGSLPAANVASI